MKDDELRLAAARAVGMNRDRDLTGPLIQRVSDPNPLVANAANDSLKIITNRDFGELNAQRHGRS
jgi:hypothetical protein